MIRSVLSLSVALLCGLAALTAAPAVAADSDDAIDQVLRMLGEGVSSSVIVEWLGKEQPAVRSLQPDDLIALSRAGASDELVATLLELAEASPAPADPAPTPVPLADPPGAPQDGLAGLAVTLHYNSKADSGGERGKRWAMFAYLDGEPLIWAKSGSRKAKTTMRLAPGPHVIHLMRESHVPKKKDRWRHTTQVSVTPIEFTVEAGEGWSLEIDWIIPTFDFNYRGALSWALTRWSNPIASRERVGDALEDWPLLCDDVRDNAPDPESPPGWVRRELKGCYEWSDLWRDLDVPDRATVRGRLEAEEFRPAL